jgi:hypothetical protein
MDVQLYQIVGGIGALLFLFLSVRQFLGGHISLRELVFWSFFWLFTLMLSLFPDPISQFLANTLGIKSNLNAIFFLGLGVLFFIQFRLYLVIRRQNEIISSLVRRIAIREDEEKEEQKKREK